MASRGVAVVGVPSETKPDEHRVALTPDGAHELVARGVEVLVQRGAGAGASLGDDSYAAAGAEIVEDPAEVWQRADVVAKVKEPQPAEVVHLREGLALFTFLHLAAYPEVARALLRSGTTGIAYETVRTPDGALPLLAPMSEIAGRMSVQAGAHFLERHNGGRGVLLGGGSGVHPGRVVVIGAGNVGWNAARTAAGLGAEVHLLDRDLARLRWVDEVGSRRIFPLASNAGAIRRAVAEADLLVGAVLVAGERAPVVVPEEFVEAMQPGSVVVDVAIDQGGCVETSRETTHGQPTFVCHDVVHYAVGNVPGAVPHTSTHALANATLPYLVELAVQGVEAAARNDPALAQGLNTLGGEVVNPAVASSLGFD